jgi:hypothetical protein
LLVILLLVAPATAFAQDADKKRRQDKCGDTSDASGKTKYEVIVGPDGKKVFRIKTGFVICGKVPKPDVLYGLLNSTINYEWENLKQDFMPRILHSVESNPF